MPDPADILKARAKALAALPPASDLPARDSQTLQVLEFILGKERYAVETPYIREVQPLTGLTQLPGAPPFLFGIVYLRGHIIGVVDLRRFFDLTTQALSNLNRVIVLEHQGFLIGLLADEIVGVRQLHQSTLTTTLPTLTGIRQDYLKGVTPDHLVILDTAKLIQDPRLVIDQTD